MKRALGCLLALTLCLGAGTASAQQRQKVTMAWIDQIEFLPLYVARAEGYFEREGLDLDLVSLPAGTNQIAAVISGAIDVAPTGFIQILRARATGGDVAAFGMLFSAFPIAIVLSPDAIQKTGIQPAMSIDEKLKRMKGLKIGITAPGGITDVFARNIFMYRNLNPEDYVALQPVGATGAMYAAFEKKVVDGFSNSSPWPELAQQTGTGRTVIDPFSGELAELKDLPYNVFATSRKTIEAKPAVINGVVRAAARAMRLLREKPEAALAVRKYFPDVNQQAIDTAVEKERKALPATMAITPQQVERTLAWMNIGAKDPVTVKFDDVVINKMMQDAEAAIAKE